MPTYRTANDRETVALGERLGTAFPLKAVALLIGNLGAGKTTLAKGIVKGRGAGDADEVTSPTFSLIHEYEGERPVYHIDLYRLEELREAATLGLDEIFDRDALCVIEWGERFPELLPAQRTEIRIRTLANEEREFEITELP